MALLDKTIEVTCRGATPGNEIWVNVWHVDVDDSLPGDTHTNGESSTLATAFEAFYEALVTAPGLHEEWTMESVTTRRVSGATGLLIPDGESFEQPKSVAGAILTDALPPQLAVVLSLKTGRAGRERRGRKYLAGFAEVHSGDPTRITAVAAGQIVTAAVGLVDDLNAATPRFRLGVLSRKLEEFTQVSQFRVGTAIDTQRRRRNRFIENYEGQTVDQDI